MVNKSAPKDSKQIPFEYDLGPWSAGDAVNRQGLPEFKRRLKEVHLPIRDAARKRLKQR